MNQPETGKAPAAAHGNSDLQQKELAEVLRQRAATSAVLRAIASSPHDLQPIFDTIIDSAVDLCRAELGAFRLSEEIGFRLVASKLSPALSEMHPRPILEHGSFVGRLFGSKSPVHIPDFITHLEGNSLGEAEREAISRGVGTLLIVPMLRNDELIGTLSLSRLRIEPFTENEIELVTDFAAQAAIALEITRRERELRELQIKLAHTNRVVTMGELSASITHEVNQPIAAARNNIIAALHFLDGNPPDLQDVREALAAAVKDADRVGAIVGRMRALMQKASLRSDPVDMNEALQEVIELTRGEALKNGVSVKTQFASLPIIAGDRVQLQQVALNLILNALQAMSAVSEGARQVIITTRQIELNDLYVGVQDTGPGLSPETLSRLFEPFYTTKPNGMGMGLTICRSIVESHGGRLWVSACQPHGALFQFAIPAQLS
ncbi:ATP-binding protein [Bradyrhizobium sp. CCGUVB1N3]|uniref:sensor histidine kinase n=1 Tax=Bradyrhizobium sp. CCGUVB1N3 TaxID=2949629 RepID=UPI0020B3C725|nr:ATP-binding protein [Bradyrhizobium sp. CCGUVB1N3]MCP3469807.1 ATP-binding protein [Bradyrhizobium sp. CCGUVB1N3]